MNAILPQRMSFTRAVLHLCAIDLRRFRWLVSGVVGVELVRATLVEGAMHLAEPTATPRLGPSSADVFVPFLDIVIVLMAAIGTAILVQADHPTDDRAFWRTRPIPPLAVAGAKLLSMALLFVVVPAVITAVRLLAYGAPPGALVAATLQIGVTAGLVCVPAWLVAVPARTMPRFLGAMLAVVIVGYFMLGTLTMLLGDVVRSRVGLFSGVVPVVFDWQHTAVHGWWGGLISTVVGLAILTGHYQVRRMTVTVAALALLVIVPTLIPTVDPEQPAPPELARRIDGRLALAEQLRVSSYATMVNGRPPTARVDGRLVTAALPLDISAAVQVDRINVRAGGRIVPAEGESQCCLGAGAVGVVLTAVAKGPAPQPSLWPRQGTGLFHVPQQEISSLSPGPVDFDADTTLTFFRHRLAGSIPLQPGASLRRDGYLIEVLAVEPVGNAFLTVLVRFTRFPSMAPSSPQLDLFRTDPSRRGAGLVWAPWPISTYNQGTTVDNWSRGRTWAGRFSFTIDRQPPLPPDALLAVVETTDIGVAHTRVTATGVPTVVVSGFRY